MTLNLLINYIYISLFDKNGESIKFLNDVLDIQFNTDLALKIYNYLNNTN